MYAAVRPSSAHCTPVYSLTALMHASEHPRGFGFSMVLAN